MTETVAPVVKTPWHLWVVGILSLLWNAMGALDFTMSQLNNAAYLKALTPEKVAAIHSFPLWAVVFWGVGTWGSALGSLLLLLKRKLAGVFFSASLVGVIVTNLYSYVLSDAAKVMGGGTPGMIFAGVIFVICLLLVIYSRAMTRRGVLR